MLWKPLTSRSPSSGPLRSAPRLRVAGSVAALAAGVAVSPVSQTAHASSANRSATDSYVSAWDALGNEAFTASALSPVEGHVIFAYAGIAVYDAVTAVRTTYEPFAIHTRAPRRTSPQAAVVAAAHRIYEHYLPEQETTILDPAYAASLATIRDGRAKRNGVAVGLRVANALIAMRANDGYRADVGYAPPKPALPGTGSRPQPHLRQAPTSDGCEPSRCSRRTASGRTDLPHSGAGSGPRTSTRSRGSAP
jgi:hypothetical protein